MDWGPENPHPLSRMKTELVWEGKYDEYGNRRPVKLPTTPLPLQRIETIDAPMDRARAQHAAGLFKMEEGETITWDEEAFRRSSHRDDFRNMLIWGDNKLALAALLERFRGKVDLIYIDPPFDVGADFSIDVAIGEAGLEIEKQQSVLEAVAYRDTWGKGQDSYAQMLYDRLALARELLSDSGSIYIHVDDHVSHLVKLVVDSVLGSDRFLNEIVWQRTNAHNMKMRYYPRFHDVLLFYTKTDIYTWNTPLAEHSEAQLKRYKQNSDGRWYTGQDLTVSSRSPTRRDTWRGSTPPAGRAWAASLEERERLWAEGLILTKQDGTPRLDGFKVFLDDKEGRKVGTIWTDISRVGNTSDERLDYDTQKPVALLERLIETSSQKDALVLDFFCGSGTTCAVAEKLGRRWIGVDLGRYAIHTTRKRLIGVQRELHAKNEPYRSFDVYNLGRYERQWWQNDRLKGADEEHRAIVLKFYKAAPLANGASSLLHGMKNGAYVHVDRIDTIFVFEEAQAVAQAAQTVGAREVHVLAWEFEMELKRKLEALTAKTGVKIRPFQIPREIMEPNRNEVQFFEAGALEAKIVRGEDGSFDVELVHFIPALAEAPEAELEMLRERAIKSPFDFIDFWAIDFDWDGIEPFEHHWQDFRTRKDRSLKTRSDAGWQFDKGKHRICVKVIDVFGVDTTTVLEVEV